MGCGIIRSMKDLKKLGIDVLHTGLVLCGIAFIVLTIFASGANYGYDHYAQRPGACQEK